MQEEIRDQLQKEGEASSQEIDLLTKRLNLQANRVSVHMYKLNHRTPLLESLVLSNVLYSNQHGGQNRFMA